MSLEKLDDVSRFYSVTEIPKKKDFDKNWRLKFNVGEEVTTKNFLYSKIQPTEKFSVGTMFPKKEWPKNPELMRIFEIAQKSELQAAYFLGLMVMEILVEDDEPWLTTKTTLGERDIATAFYWRKKL